MVDSKENFKFDLGVTIVNALSGEILLKFHVVSSSDLLRV